MTQTLFIGLDGCTYDVLDSLISDRPGEGVTMPFMRELIENGARSVLKSTPNPLTPPAWTSIMTGRSPGYHGVYDFIRAEDKGDQVFWTLYDSRDIDAELIWQIASRQDKTVAALNFPMTAPPPQGINGSIVPGFIPAKHLRRNTLPRELFKQLKDEVPGFDPKELAWDFEAEKQAMDQLSRDDTENWVRYHLPREEQWFRVAEYVLEHEQPDLMAVMFDGTDKIQHQAWSFIEPSLLEDEPDEWGKRMREVCLQYFRNLDGYIKRLVELAGPDAQVFIASDHGFTATVDVLRINSFLEEKGYLKWAEDDDSEQARRREEANFANMDWDRTHAYCRTPSSNGIHIRVARNPGDSGIKPEDYEAFREQLIRDLFEITNQDGEPMVIDVLKREEHFPGPHMEEAPDLTLVLRDYGFVSIRSYKPAVVRRDLPQGTHHPDGIFVAAGPGVSAAGMVETRQIVDVAPTLLYSAGLDVPSDLEGEVPTSFFTEQQLTERPVRQGDKTQSAGSREASEDIDDSEKQQIMDQLKMLGYME